MALRYDVAESFDRWAPTYDQSALQPLYRAAHRAVLHAARAGAGEYHRLLDVGCGTGQLLRHAAVIFPHAVTIGVDIAPRMLAIAAACAGPGQPRWVCAAVEQLPFGDATFDLVISSISLRHWADPCAGLAEIRRVLAPGGRLAIATTVPVRRHVTRRRDHCLSWADFAATGLVVDAARSAAGFGPIPAITIVTAHRAAHHQLRTLR